MNMFKKWFGNPTVTFDCLAPGVEKIMPIIPAKDYKHAWVERARQELKQIRQQPNYGMEKMIHTARCPGIFALQREGWIMRAWMDFTIEATPDGMLYWQTPLDQKQFMSTNPHDYIDFHPPMQLRQYMENWPHNTHDAVVKVASPWRARIPKGYYLMEIPVSFSDENRFTPVPGFFSYEFGYAHLSPQLLWHSTQGKILVKAGTPIAQYILVPKRKYDMEIEVIGDEPTRDNFHRMAGENRFVKNFAEAKKIMSKYSDK